LCVIPVTIETVINIEILADEDSIDIKPYKKIMT